MKSSADVEALIELENRSPQSLFATLPGSDLPIWPFLRQPLARAAADAEHGTAAVQSTPLGLGPNLTRIAKQLTPDRFSSMRISKRKPYLYLCGGTTFRQTPVGRQNWLVDAFAAAFEDQSVVLQDLPVERGNREAYPLFPHSFSFADAAARVEVSTKIFPLPSSAADAAQKAIREIIREFPIAISPADASSLEHSVLYGLSRVKHVDAEFRHILRRVQPEIVFIESASYGGLANIISMLKQHGVLVVELQHGWIGPYHTAYNFGEAMSAPELFKTLPDVLLTFGEFWSRNIRHPSVTPAIGKPHLEETAIAAKAASTKAREVVVISSVFQRDELTTFTLKLRRLLPQGWKLRFRPHPSERSAVSSLYPGLVGQAGIEFDEHADVVDSLATASAVFGYSSTVLYEALMFGCEVFVIDSPLADYSSDVETFGERVKDDETLQRAVEVIQVGRAEASSLLDDIWKPNAIKNFQAFVQAQRPATSLGTP